MIVFIGDIWLLPILICVRCSKRGQLAVERAIRLCRGNRTKAAALLGISRDTLYRKIRELKADAGL